MADRCCTVSRLNAALVILCVQLADYLFSARTQYAFSTSVTLSSSSSLHSVVYCLPGILCEQLNGTATGVPQLRTYTNTLTAIVQLALKTQPIKDQLHRQCHPSWATCQPRHSLNTTPRVGPSTAEGNHVWLRSMAGQSKLNSYANYNCRLSLNSSWLVMHSPYLKQLREIANGSCHASAKQNLCRLLDSACLYMQLSALV